MRLFIGFLLLLFFSPHVSAQESMFDRIIEQVRDRATKVCGGKDDCLRAGISLANFLWSNRDKTDVHKNTAKCVGVVAFNRGYLLKPMSVLDLKDPDDFLEVSIEICDCVIGYWGKDAMCRQALVERDAQSLAAIFNR